MVVTNPPVTENNSNSSEETNSTSTITVTVDDENEDPLQNVAVTLTDSSDSSKTFTGTTDANGEATISNVPYSTYVLTATKSGYDDYTAVENLTVNASTGTASITMNLTTVNISVSVDDGDSTPVEGAEVILTDTTDSSVTFSGTTGSAGGCTLSNVPLGTYTVTATCTGYTDYTGSENLTVTSETTTLSISMTSTGTT